MLLQSDYAGSFVVPGNIEDDPEEYHSDDSNSPSKSLIHFHSYNACVPLTS